MCMMAADTMEALGIPRGSYVVKVNNRKVLDGVMESIGLGGEEHAGKGREVRGATDKVERLGVDGVKQLLGEGRKDESGDFTKGAQLSDKQTSAIINLFVLQWGPTTTIPQSQVLDFGIDAVKEIVDDDLDEPIYAVYDNDQILDQLRRVLPNGILSSEGVEELNSIAALIAAAGYDTNRIRIDPSVVRGLEYYTGPVYEVELLLDTKDEKGRPVRFGSVGGGGRYDGLVSRFRGEPVPATGFSIGVSRLPAPPTLLGQARTPPPTRPPPPTGFPPRSLP